MAANAAIKTVIDSIAKGIQLDVATWPASAFWTKVDAAADQTFEDIVKGATVTAMEASLALSTKGRAQPLATMWGLLEAYAANQGYNPSAGVPGLSAYLDAVGGWRVPYHAAFNDADATGAAFPARQVFPKGTLPASGTPVGSGMHTFGVFGGGALTGSDGALPSACGPAAMLAVNMSAAQTVGATLRCTNWVAATPVDIALSLSSAAQYAQTVLGQTTVASGVTAGDLAVQVAATTNLTAGEWVLIWESDALQEAVRVLALATTPTRFTVAKADGTAGAVRNSFTTAAKVFPLFRSVAYLSGASGSGNVNLYARPDRIIAQ